jgi:hypothetical protein
MIEAILANHQQQDLPPVPVCFPIADYMGIYENLQAIGIGSATERDCLVTSIEGSYPILKRLEKVAINVDELDYLAKRLESFDKNEIAKFQGVAESRGYFDMVDLINLTFCCQEVTVVRDFSDLRAIGRDHYMDIHGGVTETELRTIDFQKIALNLILNEDGKVTPYGVIYENGMRLEHLYNRRHFPDYDYYGDTIMVMEMTDRNEPENSDEITWLYLPMEDCQIERSMLRAGIDSFADMRLRFDRCEMPSNLSDLLTGGENLRDLNAMCASFQALDKGNRKKLEAVAWMASPSNIMEVKNLIEQLDLFDFVPGVSSAEEYGRYMIMESGYFRYDGELDGFYDFKKYGDLRIANEQGQFTPEGYVSYHGFISLAEVLAGSQSERLDMTMGCM